MNTLKDTFNNLTVHMHPLSFSLRRKMESLDYSAGQANSTKKLKRCIFVQNIQKRCF
jgi:hypothetical protein